MKRILKILDDKLEPFLINILFVSFTVIILIEVFRRYVLNSPSDWAEELARYMFVYMIYLAAAWAVKTGSHLRIDILLLKMPPGRRIYFETFADACFVICAIAIITYSLQIMKMQLEMGTLAQSRFLMDLKFNMAFAYASLPLGWGLTVIRLIQREVRMWRTYLQTGKLEQIIRMGE